MKKTVEYQFKMACHMFELYPLCYYYNIIIIMTSFITYVTLCNFDFLYI